MMFTRRSWLTSTLAALAGVLSTRAAARAIDTHEEWLTGEEARLDALERHDAEIAAFDDAMGVYDCAECGAYGAKRYPIEEPMSGIAWFPEGGYEAIPTQPVLHVKALCDRCLYFRRMMVDRAALRYSVVDYNSY